MTNIAGLLLIGSLAEQVLWRREWLAIYGLGGLIAEGVALFWQPVGAGNSVAICALAGSLVAGRPDSDAKWTSVVPRTIANGAAVILVAMRDIHGAAAFIGAAVGAGMLAIRRND